MLGGLGPLPRAPDPGRRPDAGPGPGAGSGACPGVYFYVFLFVPGLGPEPRAQGPRAWTGETRLYIGQTEKWQKINPITMNLDETKWDRIPPMSRTFLGGSGGRRGPNWVIWGGAMYALISPAPGPGPWPGARAREKSKNRKTGQNRSDEGLPGSRQVLPG